MSASERGARFGPDIPGAEPVMTVVLRKEPGGWHWEVENSAYPFMARKGFAFTRWGARSAARRSARQWKLRGQGPREEFTL